jgi:hypothetical protein
MEPQVLVLILSLKPSLTMEVYPDKFPAPSEKTVLYSLIYLCFT